ncbi:unnamed protein product [Scytosiphon promiscuus]
MSLGNSETISCQSSGWFDDVRTFRTRGALTAWSGSCASSCRTPSAGFHLHLAHK